VVLSAFSMALMATYLLLDGHSLAFRAWFALQEADLTTASGQKTAAVYGFAGMLGRLLDDHSPAGMAVAFDRPEPTFRDAIADDYKAGRAVTPEPLREQIDLIRRLVETLGVPVVELAGYEADDVIATLATSLEKAGEDVIIVTGDRDSYQLVSDPHVRVLYNRRGVTDYVLYDEAGIVERTGVRPEQYPFLAALKGDPSDNLPGVPGVGDKTAAKLVNTYGDIDNLFAHLDDQTPKLRASLAASEARVRQNFALTPLVRDVPVELPLERLAFGGSDRAEMESLFTLLEIKGPRDRIVKALDRLESGAPPGSEPGADAGGAVVPALAPIEVTVLDDVPTAAGWLDALSAADGPIVVEPEWAGAPGRSALVGLAFCRVAPAGAPTPSGKGDSPSVGAAAGPESTDAPPGPPTTAGPAAGPGSTAGAESTDAAPAGPGSTDAAPAGPGSTDAGRPIEGGPDRAAIEVGWVPGELIAEPGLADSLRRVLGRRPGDTPGRLIAHRAKELMRALAPNGIEISGLGLDTAVAGYLADPRIGQATLERLADAASGMARGDGDRFSVGGAGAGGAGGRGQAEQLGFDLAGDAGDAGDTGDATRASPAAEAAARRAVVIAGLAPALTKALVEAGAERLYREVEQPLIGVLAKMELAGIAVDIGQLEAISREMTEQVASLEAEIQRLAGEEFNVNSTAQLRHILFDKLGLAPQKRTKTGYSTDAQSLERLRGRHEIIDTLLAYREVEKLRSTYGIGLLSEVAPDGRIHASFNQTVARTGRLSSDQPNLHNIPVRSALGRRFRQAFIPGQGAELLVADYDQIELRVIAHLAQDPGLIEAFREGVDIHGATASRVFSVAVEDVTTAQRSKAKMISYGLAYGMEAYGLSQRLSVPVEEATEILAQYFAAFPNVKEYMSRTVGEARLRGYTETLFGRRRYLPELDSPNYRVRQAAERQAMNAGIQGLAADIFKVALVALDAELTARGLASRVVLQVHDEILVESLLEEADEVSEVTLEVMKAACTLDVPLAVHVARGASWAEAKGVGGSAPDDDSDDDADIALDFELAFEAPLHAP
jgi:DNA polymerase I-like protein with 3'-5' exonuclease and polymerase domains/5'-3' exonuclease